MHKTYFTFILFFYSVLTFAQWEQRTDPPFVKDHGIGFSLDGYGYVLTGGSDGLVFSATKAFYKYDPVADSWETLPDYPGPSRGYGIGDTWDGKLYFGFGQASNGSLLDDLWEWDPVTDVFTELPSCPCAGRAHPAFVAVDGKVYVGAGGAASNLADWWEYDIANQTWLQKTSMPGARHHPYQFALDGEIYVGNGHLSSWNKYNPTTDSWSPVASLVARVAGAQFSYNGKGYVLSGGDINHDSFPTGEFWEYDPIGDTWLALPNHPSTSRFGPTQFVIDNYIYLAGGYYRMGSTFTGETTMWRYQLGPSISGIEEDHNLANSGFIYPNPVNEEINIKLDQDLSDEAVLNIYDLSGQLILTSPFQITIDVADLENGMYILDVVDGGSTILREKFSKT